MPMPPHEKKAPRKPRALPARRHIHSPKERTMKKATLALFAALLAALTLAGCNTVHGLGQDVQAGGRAIERAADR